MLYVSCDGCGKQLRKADEHHVVKIEVFVAQDTSALTEDDLDADHLESVAQILRDAEEADEPAEAEPRSARLRFDLCCGCRSRYLRDPLGREQAQKFHFSPN